MEVAIEENVTLEIGRKVNEVVWQERGLGSTNVIEYRFSSETASKILSEIEQALKVKQGTSVTFGEEGSLYTEIRIFDSYADFKFGLRSRGQQLLTADVRHQKIEEIRDKLRKVIDSISD